MQNGSFGVVGYTLMMVLVTQPPMQTNKSDLITWK